MKKLVKVKILLLVSFLMFVTSAQATTLSSIVPVRDRSLTEFLHNAVVNHPQVLAEIASLEARNAELRAAGKAIYNPELEFDAENASDSTYSLGINQTIDFGNKRSARKQMAASKQALSKSRLEAVKNTVRIKLLKALAGFHSTSKQLKLAENRLHIIKGFSNLASRKYRAGDLSKTEVTLANLSLTQAQIGYATQQSIHAEAEQELRLQTQNFSSNVWPSLPNKVPSISADEFDIQQLVINLPEVQAAQNEVSLLSDRINLKQRERKPDPTVGIRAGDEDSDTLIGINLSIPLYVRNNYDDDVVAAQAEERESNYRYQYVFNSAQARLIAATQRYKSTYEAWSTWESGDFSGFDKLAGLLKRLWEAGEISTSDYLIQLNQILNMQNSATNLQLQLWRSWFDWLGLSGQVTNWLGE